jgi:L,D-peptidoglycan transpeptidase YkuD (ErfK/YbiS/YcfS/YnhG family)
MKLKAKTVAAGLWAMTVLMAAGLIAALAALPAYGEQPLPRPPLSRQPLPRHQAQVESSAVARTACPDNLADRLSHVGRARELVTVEAAGSGTSEATVETWQRPGSCWEKVDGPWAALIGVNGFSGHHREGDGTTPTGMYGIGPVMYGNAPDPGTKYPYHRLVCGDWWDEDPTSPRYNTFQHVACGQAPPFGGESEALWTETAAYPSFAVIEYNARPVVPYAGSAIFIHADIGAPTAGCVSVAVADLDALLRWLTPNQAPMVAMGPSGELERF